MSVGSPTLEVRDLKTYFRTPSGLAKAVDGLSFSIPKKGTLALVGESGCGKSVAALSIIQLVPEPAGFVAAGSIMLNGVDILKMSEREKRALRGNRVSMVFQEPMTSLNPVFTIGEQITEAISLHQAKGKTEARAIAIAMLKKVKLPDPEALFDEYPHRLSGGQRQRVMIAIALACRPDLLIADEPTTALDVTIQAEILALIKELKESSGASVLLITHNLALVRRNSDEVGVMYAGRIVEKAATDELFSSPMHPYTQMLLRSIPGFKMRGALLQSIPGAVPPATSYAMGCRFSGRCYREMKGCAAVQPKEVLARPGHTALCHLYDHEFMSTKDSAPLESREEAPSLEMEGKRDAETILDVRGLKTYYPVRKGIFKRVVGHVKAVDGIDLKIRRGSTLALVGESGCGKTTAGKTILRLIDPASGEALFKGRDILTAGRKELRNARSKMQIIFQDPYSSLNPRQTIKDILEEGLKILRPEMRERERMDKVSLTLRLVGLSEDSMFKYPHEFSGGQRQRVGIARALAVDPEFIVCDEATSALDVSVQAQILNLLKSIQRGLGISFLFITHDLGVVEYMADEVAIMHEGRIVERGETLEVFSSPRHPYTKRLLDAVPRID
jgi:oligopeptide/dipeptide ABC transporter ATP-binding protein